MPPLRAPVEKLPLSLRKNLRDNYEAKKPELQSKLSDMLGETWTVEANPNLIYAYADDQSGKERLGDVIMWYLDPFVDNLQTFLSKFGDDGKSELNEVCSAHKVVFQPQETTKFTYGGLEIKDGALRIVFSESNLGVNASDITRDISGALKAAPPPPGGAKALNIEARNGIRDDYDSKVEEVRAAIALMVGVSDLKLNGNFDHNASMIAKLGPKADLHWDQYLGRNTLGYFEGVQYQIERQGFEGDDMLQEGFQEAITKGEICLRIVDKLNKGTYNEIIIEDGVLYVQTVPSEWNVNTSDAASKLLDIL